MAENRMQVRQTGETTQERLQGSPTNAVESRSTERLSRISLDEDHTLGSRPSSNAADLRAYLRILRHRWTTVVGVFCVVVAAVMVGTLWQDAVYRATGMIEIRKQASEVLPAEAVFQMARITDQYLETEYEMLRSPALAQRVLNDLFRTKDEKADSGSSSNVDHIQVSADSHTGKTLERAIEQFQKRLIVDPIRGSRLVRIHFDSEDPQLAARIVNLVVANYTGMRVEAGRAAEARLSEQVDSVRVQLTASEQNLQEYLRQSELLFVDTGAGESENIIHERLRRLQQQLTEAEAERYTKQSLYNLVSQQGADYLDSDVLRSLSVRVADLRSEHAKLRSTFTEDYPRTKQVKNQLDELEAILAKERRRIASAIENDYKAALRSQDLLRAAFNEQKARVDHLAGQTAEYHVLKREVTSHQDLFALLQQKRREAEVSAALAATEVGIVNQAIVPQKPIRPNPEKNLQLAAIVGLVIGMGLAFLRELADPTVRTVEQIDLLSDRPILALIPSIDSLQRDQQRSGLSEAFGALRTSVLLDIGKPGPRSMLVTSAQPQEGKTTVSTNLALSLAKLGHRVLLVDADIRRPAVHRALNLHSSLGLVDYLSGSAGWQMLIAENVVPGLDVLPAGRPPEEPSELLSSKRMRELVDGAHATYDFVVLDSPALFINAADTRILAPLTEGVVLVIRSGITPRDVAKRMLKQVPNIIGIVLNDLDVGQLPAYYGDYSERQHGSNLKQTPHRRRRA